MFSKNLEVDCFAAAPTVSPTGNRRQNEGHAVFRVRAGEKRCIAEDPPLTHHVSGNGKWEQCRARQGGPSPYLRAFQLFLVLKECSEWFRSFK